MPLQGSWVDHLFGRLTVRYGAAFLRQWPDIDIDSVKADWADVLDGTSGHAIGYALRYLPQLPPNALQFRDTCRRAPAPEDVARITESAPPRDPERVKEAMHAMGETKRRLSSKSPAQECIDNIERIAADRGGNLSGAQQHVVESCLLMPGTNSRLVARRVEAEQETEYVGA